MDDDTSDLPSRRDAIRSAAMFGTAALIGAAGAMAQPAASTDAAANGGDRPPGEPERDYTPVVVPNGWTLPYALVDGVKVFHLVAEEVEHEFAPGLRARCWGYNGSVHGPVIEAVEGDRVRIFVTNRLAAPTTVHWHGMLVPSGMDGVGGLSQRAIRPGETYHYEFTLRQHGTLMYHSHHDEMTQMGMGMVGMFVIHPRPAPGATRPDRDFAIMLHEWSIPVGSERPNPNEMTDFNVLTMNARVFPGTAPLVVRQGERVRIRLGNLGAMDHHPIHLHGYSFNVVETDGGRIPEAGQWPATTVLVAAGSTRTIEFLADKPGDWSLHCHMTHHVMTQMGHGTPNMIGVDADGLDGKVRSLLPGYMTMGATGMSDTGDMGMRMPANSLSMVGGAGRYDPITMGGMFTILKVREDLPNGYDADPGWYAPPAGTLASIATLDALRINQVAPDGSSAPRNPARALAPSARSLPTQGHVPEPNGHGGHLMNGAQASDGMASTQIAAATTHPTSGVIYTCPMHPEVVSDKPGTCPKCGMTLAVKR